MTRALDDFNLALQFDPENADAKQGLARVRATAMSKKDDLVRENALKDPSVKMILSDPVINNVLRDLQSNPRAAQECAPLRCPAMLTLAQGDAGPGRQCPHREVDDRRYHRNRNVSVTRDACRPPRVKRFIIQ